MKISYSFLLAGSMLAVPVFAADGAKNSLPLKNVVLFSSGVGYFGRGGRVDGNADVELKVRGPQVSDILKSLVLLDPKGTVKPVTYSIEDWIKQRPRETDLPLDVNSSLGSLLRPLQGTQIRLLREAGPMEGRVVSVTQKSMAVKEGGVHNPEFIILATNKGLRTINLETVEGVELVDPKLDAKFQNTLLRRAEALTAQVNDELRSINISFGGKGARDVRAGYLLETPAWKTSYRLVLNDKQRPLLQGWAVVENTTDEDWKDVRLSLVSGRPVSFIQNLYAPMYVGRPVVSVGLPNASPVPQTFGEGFDPSGKAMVNENGAPARPGGAAGGGGGFGGGGRTPGLAGRAGGIFSNSGAYNSAAMDARREVAEAVNDEDKVAAQAKGSEKGELFEYAIDDTVTLDRGRAAMVPIVSQDVNAEAVTIVDSGKEVGAQIPTNGLCLKNDSGLHLQGGAITVFAGGIYAGDALITNISPNDSRLITYALDLESMVRLDQIKTDTAITAINAGSGSLTIKQLAEKTLVYTVRNKSNKNRTYILQVPEDALLDLKNKDQLYEKSNEGLRFRFEVPAGKSLVYTIESHRPQFETAVVANLPNDTISYYVSQKNVSKEARQAFDEILARRDRLDKVQKELAAQEAQLKDIEADQSRIRSNMGALSQQSPLYKQYEGKLAQQEPRIEKIRDEIVRLRTAVAELKVGLERYATELAF